MKTGYECTAYFRGIDGRGTCDTECQWWTEQGCVCAKDSMLWDGKEHYAKEPRNKPAIERACAKADKKGKIILHAISSLEWKEREMRKLGLDPESHIGRAFFEEINE